MMKHKTQVWTQIAQIWSINMDDATSGNISKARFAA